MRGALVLFGLFIGASRLNAQPTNTSDLQGLARQSRFIFQGTVRQSGANMAAVPPSPANAVVHVERVLAAPRQLGDFTGRDITVLLAKSESPKVGQSAVFFTNGWIYGKTLAVREVVHIDSAGQNIDAFRSSIVDAQRANEEQDLARLLASAETVVAGLVVKIAPLPRQEFRLPITEHDPELWQAVVQVEKPLKGQTSTDRTVSFLFANSRDVMWERSPKVKEGQDAVWILRRDEKNGLKLGALTVFDPNDVQPRSRLDLIGRLLGSLH
jgi:hypothetical protein